MTSLPAKILIAPIRFYQRFITPYTPATCRYYPTCSAYAVTALRTRGAVVGSGLTIWRLLRCNPWSDGGIDHVPAKGWLRHRSTDHPAGDGCAEDGDRSADGPTPGADEHHSGENRAGGIGEHDTAGHDTAGHDTAEHEGGEREHTVGSSPTGAAVDPPARTDAATDLDAPHSAAAEPMTGRSAA